MAGLARTVIPGLPHQVTQRGNGRAKAFFTPEDYPLYKPLLVEHCRVANVGIWAWCLMPNHVPLILTPADPGGLRRALAKVHRGKRKPEISGKGASVRRDGRGPPFVGGAVCRTEPGARGAGETGGRLALIKRSGVSDR
ncbi:hypothetical protein [Mesorhizobium sp. WSM4310]|uniref:hypothetical protein n=1 Tax=Mesorhizobium sp. WSM4310 TaxID=2589883 RepID=UPI001FF03C6D|nr:hypothetical protein [Mesorhizobium sp. WSM4310]